MPQNDNTVLFENARIIFRNFAGKEGMYNREGERNFCVLLDDDVAEAMARDGWNVKTLKPRESDEEPRPQPYLEVKLGYKGRPPRIVMITSRGRTDLSEEEVEVLDYADIRQVDLILNPYSWGPINGKSGIKAYLKSLFVTIEEDELEMKYGDIHQVPSRSGRVDE